MHGFMDVSYPNDAKGCLYPCPQLKLLQSKDALKQPLLTAPADICPNLCFSEVSLRVSEHHFLPWTRYPKLMGPSSE